MNICLELWGKRADEVLNKPIFEGLPEAKNQGLEELVYKVYTTGEKFVANERPVNLPRNGKVETTYVNFVYDALREVNGDISGIIATATEVTTQVEARRKIEESEGRLRLANEASGVAVWEWDLITGQIKWDNEMFRIYGVTPTVDNIVDYTTWSTAVVPEELAQQENILQNTVKNLGQSSRSFKIKRASDGELRHIEAIETVRTNEAGQAEWVVGTNLDVTEKVEARKKVEDSEERFQAAVKAVQGILWTNNAIGEMEGEQSGWASLTGQTYGEYQGYGWAEAVHPDDKRLTLDAWNEAVEERRTFIFEHRVKTKEGQWRDFSVRAIPLTNTDGTFAAMGRCTY